MQQQEYVDWQEDHEILSKNKFIVLIQKGLHHMKTPSITKLAYQTIPWQTLHNFFFIPLESSEKVEI